MKRLVVILSVLFSLVCGGIASAAELPPDMFGYQYDEFRSFSIQQMLHDGIVSGEPWDSATGTGGLDLLLYTGPGGQNNVNVGLAPNLYTFPDPLSSPSGGGSGSDVFHGIWGDGGTVPVDQLYSYLRDTFDSSTPVFLFDMGEPADQSPDPDYPFMNVSDLLLTGEFRIMAGDTVVASWSFDAINDGSYQSGAWAVALGMIPSYYDPTVLVPSDRGNGKADFVAYAPEMDLTAYLGQGLTVEGEFNMTGLNGTFEELYLTGIFTPERNMVPEPSSVVLLGLGLLFGAAGLRMKRKQ